MRYRVGIDVGGTFTDGVAIDEKTGDVCYTKVLSTPSDPSKGFLKNLDALIEKSGLSTRDIWLMIVGFEVLTRMISPFSISSLTRCFATIPMPR